MWCLLLVTPLHSCGLETVLALLQMGGVFIGTIFAQPFSVRKWGFKAKSRKLLRLQNLSLLVSADPQNELVDLDLYSHGRVDQLLFLEVSSILADPWPDKFSRWITFVFLEMDESFVSVYLQNLWENWWVEEVAIWPKSHCPTKMGANLKTLGVKRLWGSLTSDLVCSWIPIFLQFKQYLLYIIF